MISIHQPLPDVDRLADERDDSSPDREEPSMTRVFLDELSRAFAAASCAERDLHHPTAARRLYEPDAPPDDDPSMH